MSSFARSALFLSIQFLLSSSTSMALAAPPVPLADQQPVAFPEGVADSTGQTAFVRNPVGGIDAINLADGTLLWRSPEATLPLLAGRRLVAQAPVPGQTNQVRLVLLDLSQKGKRVWASDPFTLPEDVAASDGEGHSFAAQARVMYGRLLYQWWATTWYTGGAPPPPNLPISQTRTGLARVDSNSGRVEALPSGQETNESQPLPPALAGVKSSPYHDNSQNQMRTDLLRRGNRVLALEVREDGDGVALVCKSWRLPDGQAEAPRVLLRGRYTLYPSVGQDSRHLFVYAQHGRGDGWWVYDLDTGRELGRELRLDRTAARLEVVGGRLFYLAQGPTDVRGGVVADGMTPRTLRCVSLPAGRELWRRPVAGVPNYLPRP